MLARPRTFVRSHPGRVAAGFVALLLACGAVVASVGGLGDPEPDRALSSESTGLAVPTTIPDSPRMIAGGAAATKSRSSGDASYSMPSEAAAEQAADAAPGKSALAADRPVAPVPPGVGPPGLGGTPVPRAVATGTSRVVKNATLEVELKKGGLLDGYQRAVDATTAVSVGGWVQASRTGADNATLTLKVPSAHLEEVVGKIRDIGSVKSVAETGEDVTAEFVDLEARIGHWRAQEAVFVGLMAKARTIPETIQIQQQLSTITEQIEQLEGRRKFLDGQTSFSTISLSLREAGAAAPKDDGPRPASTLARAWHRSAGAALAVLGGTLVVLGVLVPLGAVVGLPTWLALALLRRRSNRQISVVPVGQG